MPKARIVSFALLVSVTVILAAELSLAKTTVAVGTCQPGLVSYSTISEAVAAVKPHSTVLVCPGTYPEQVTITIPLTLTGLSEGANSYPVITVPGGGLVGGSGAQLSVVANPYNGSVGPVNISNLVIDGAGAVVDCTMGSIVGILYGSASGSLDNVEVRNQNPGGCGWGIWAKAHLYGVGQTLTIQNSYVHDFDNTGIYAWYPLGAVSGSFYVDLSSSVIASNSPTVQAGVQYLFAAGRMTNTTITLAGGTGLELSNLPGYLMNIKENAISGASVGIQGAAIITHNNLSGNSTGILVGDGGAAITSNTIMQSSTVAIDLDCGYATAEHNNISDAPKGIANIGLGDVVKGNIFSDVTTPTTTCSH
ncbi:MAG: hypothetical protein WBS24_14225 [Terriglobales bacterium]